MGREGGKCGYQRGMVGRKEEDAVPELLGLGGEGDLGVLLPEVVTDLIAEVLAKSVGVVFHAMFLKVGHQMVLQKIRGEVGEEERRGKGE